MARTKKLASQHCCQKMLQLSLFEPPTRQELCQLAASQALVFLRRQFVVPFINDKVNELHRQGIQRLAAAIQKGEDEF